MHAVRVAEQAKELLTSGFITFPRPEREFLLKIRKGELPYQEVANVIEQGLENIEALQQKSKLPEVIDVSYWESWVMNAYGEYVSEHFRHAE